MKSKFSEWSIPALLLQQMRTNLYQISETFKPAATLEWSSTPSPFHFLHLCYLSLHLSKHYVTSYNYGHDNKCLLFLYEIQCNRTYASDVQLIMLLLLPEWDIIMGWKDSLEVMTMVTRSITLLSFVLVWYTKQDFQQLQCIMCARDKSKHSQSGVSDSIVNAFILHV